MSTQTLLIGVLKKLKDVNDLNTKFANLHWSGTSFNDQTGASKPGGTAPIFLIK